MRPHHKAKPIAPFAPLQETPYYYLTLALYPGRMFRIKCEEIPPETVREIGAAFAPSQGELNYAYDELTRRFHTPWPETKTERLKVEPPKASAPEPKLPKSRVQVLKDILSSIFRSKL
jgi:hypothetical protein